MRSLLAALLLGCVALLATACAASQAAAAKDPMRCERDPSCKGHQRAFDCNTQCSDDPGCIERCNEIQTETGTSLGH
jgi:hypothetical protein